MADPRVAALPPEQQKLYFELKEAHDAIARRNPLEKFHACAEWCGSPACPAPSERNPAGGRPKQHEYMAAPSRIVLAAAGNRFGKTTANVVWSIIQHAPIEMLPERLHEFKRERAPWLGDQPVTGRYIAPSEKSLLNIVIPAYKQWIPPELLRGKSWEKAYTDKYKVLHFHDGGRLEFFTSEQDPAVMVGTSLDYVVFDEPTTQAVFNENWIRLADRRGAARFGLTPVNMQGGGIGWLYRSIYKPGLLKQPFLGTDLVPQIVRGTIQDNPDMTDADIAEALAVYDPDEREARATGEFVAFGGLIYPAFRKFLIPVDPQNEEHREMIQSQSTIVGIDPSYRRAAFVWIAFNDQNQGLVYHAEYVKKGDPLKFKAALERGNKLWGLKQQPLYVMDPYAGGQHSMVAGQAVTIKSELQLLGIYTQAPKVLDSSAIVYGGVSNIWRRMAERPPSFAVNALIDPDFLLEFEEYRTEEREDGVFQVVKEFDDGMDAMRYAFTQRPWYPRPKQSQPRDQWTPSHAPDWSLYNTGGPLAEYPSVTGSMT
jgi:hypothetical protein